MRAVPSCIGAYHGEFSDASTTAVALAEVSALRRWKCSSRGQLLNIHMLPYEVTLAEKRAGSVEACLMINSVLHCVPMEGVASVVDRCTSKKEARMRKMMQVMLSVIVAFALCAGAASADCGVKDTHEGTLKSVDADKNVIVVAGADGEEVSLTLTADSQVTDAEGNDAKATDLIGKKVKVVSEHAKVDTVQQLA